jgi:hypothetical protein
MVKSLKVGTVCITVNTNHPACNDGVLVVVVGINYAIRDKRGAPAPYWIRRLDGQPFISTHDRKTHQQNWCKWTEVWSAWHKLKPVEGGQHDLVVERADALEGVV